MTRVERGNIVLYVEDNEVDHYLNLGYSVTDEFGNVITESNILDMTTLKTRYLEAKKTIESLNETIVNLTTELEALKKTRNTKRKQ